MRSPSSLSAAALVLSLMFGCGQPVSTSTEVTTAEDTDSASQISSSTDATETLSTEGVPPAIFTEDSIAIQGADPVAYFTEDRYIPGSADYTYE